MGERLYYELIYNGRVLTTVYDEKQIITAFYDIVNGFGINPDDIIIKAYIDGVEVNKND